MWHDKNIQLSFSLSLHNLIMPQKRSNVVLVKIWHWTSKMFAILAEIYLSTFSYGCFYSYDWVSDLLSLVKRNFQFSVVYSAGEWCSLKKNPQNIAKIYQGKTWLSLINIFIIVRLNWKHFRFLWKLTFKYKI